MKTEESEHLVSKTSSPDSDKPECKFNHAILTLIVVFIVVLIEFHTVLYFDKRAGTAKYYIPVWILIFIAGYSYILTFITSPGTITNDERFSLSNINEVTNIATFYTRKNEAQAVYDKSYKIITDMRFCYWCRKLKPDRTHHCRKCNKCILRMNHHCLWFSNCIGYFNSKYFVLTVFYMSIALSISNFYLLKYYYSLMTSNIDLNNFSIISMACIILLSIVKFIFLFLITTLVRFNFFKLYHNLTTLEYCEGSNSASISRRPNWKKDFFSNVSEVLGTNYLFWLIPTKPKLGTGYEFQLNEKESYHTSPALNIKFI